MFHSLSSETWRWQYTSTSVCIHILPVTRTERVFLGFFCFFLNDVTLFTFLSLFKRKIIFTFVKWIKAPNVVGMRSFGHLQIPVSVAGLLAGRSEMHWAPFAPLLCSLLRKQILSCVFVGEFSRDPVPAQQILC